jgi:hypothetical protein
MLPSPSKKLFLIAAVQIFAVFSIVRAADFAKTLPEADNFEHWKSLSLSGALVQPGADERMSIAEANTRSPFTQLLPPPIPARDPDLATNSSQAGQLPPGPTGLSDPSMKLQAGQSEIISGAPGDTVVISLKNFILSGDSVFTLQGTATTTFVINVTKQFSLSGNARINLDGVQSSNVLFNIQGAGSAIALSGNASLSGTLIANGRAVRLSGNSTVNGVIHGDRLRMDGNSRVIPPPLTSP